MNKPSSSDVARLAGVSQATVSLILNNSEKISFSEETKVRVFAAAEQLGYKLPVRKRRESAESKRLLVFTPTLTNHYYSELIQYVEEYADARGYHVIVCNTFRKPDMERYYLDTRVNHHVCGIIYTFLPSDRRVVESLTASVPVVIIGEKQDDVSFCSIGLNNVNAGAILAEHLYQLGHRRFAFFSTPFNHLTMARPQRLEGIRRQLESHGLGDNLEIILSERLESDHDPASGEPYEYAIGCQLTEDYLSGRHKATALIGVNDMVALGIMTKIQDYGYKIPGDFSVCGFDNVFLSRITTPGLTTIDHHLRARAQMAVDMLVGENPVVRLHSAGALMPKVNKIEYVPRLMIRGSTGPCKGK